MLAKFSQECLADEYAELLRQAGWIGVDVWYDSVEKVWKVAPDVQINFDA